MYKYTLYMEIHVHSTLALRNKKEKEGEVTHPTTAQTNKQYYIAIRTPGCPVLRTGAVG